VAEEVELFLSELDPESDLELAESLDEPLELPELSAGEVDPLDDPTGTVLDPLRLSVR
jgi:hypothetical protein